MDDGEIPVVNLEEEDAVVIERIRHAATTVGYFMVLAHGLEHRAVAEAFDASATFFALSPEAKLAASSANRALRGYSASSTENFASLAGVKGPNDLVEKIRVGPPRTPAAVNPKEQRRLRPFFFPNTFPDEPKSFRPAIER